MAQAILNSFKCLYNFHYTLTLLFHGVININTDNIINTEIHMKGKGSDPISDL